MCGEQRVCGHAWQHPYRKGNREIRTALVEAASAAAQTNAYLGARFRRFAPPVWQEKRRQAAVAVAHNLLIIIWYVLRDRVELHDLWPDYFTRAGGPRPHGTQGPARSRVAGARIHRGGRSRGLNIISTHPGSVALGRELSRADSLLALCQSTPPSRFRYAPPGAVACPLTVGFLFR